MRNIKKVVILYILFLSIKSFAIEMNAYSLPQIFQSNGYRLQGIASSCEDKKECKNEKIYVSIYNIKKKNSIILVFQEEQHRSFKPKECYLIDDETYKKAHMGGLAYFNKYLYISTKKHIIRLNLPNYSKPFNNDLNNCKPIKPSKILPVKDGLSSFISTVQKDNKYFLFVGSYCDNMNIVKKHKNAIYYCKEKKSGKFRFPYAYLYSLDNSGNISTLPVEKYMIPFKTQGVGLLPYKIFEQFFFTSESGVKQSSINLYELKKLKCDDIDFSKRCPKYQTQKALTNRLIVLQKNKKLSFTIAPYSEDLSITYKKIWTGTEKKDQQKIFYIQVDDNFKNILNFLRN